MTTPARSAETQQRSPPAAEPHIAARRVAQTVIHGIHGRRRAGRARPSGSFGLSVRRARLRVDWRRSAREERASCASANGRPRTPSGSGSTVALDAFGSNLAPSARRSTARRCWRSPSPICACMAASARACRPHPAVGEPGVVERFAEGDRDRRETPRRPRSRAAAFCAAASRSMVLMLGDSLSRPEESRARSARRALRARSANS